MIDLILHALQLGMVLTFLVGPVFFTIIQTSIEHGFWRGALVAIGVSLSDILYVTICYFGFAQVMADSGMRLYLAYGGGAILIGFGVYHLFFKTRSKNMTVSSPITERRQYRYVVKGFLINGMTPMVLLFWIGTVSLATLTYGYSRPGEFALFFTFLLATVLSTDILKAYLADKLRRLLTPQSLRIMNLLLGIALIFFGAHLIWTAKSITLPGM